MINNIIRGSLVALVGILLIVLNESVMPLLVRLLGVVFFLPAFISLVNLYMKRKGTPMFPMLMMNVINIGSVILGILLMLFPIAFLEFFVITTLAQCQIRSSHHILLLLQVCKLLLHKQPIHLK